MSQIEGVPEGVRILRIGYANRGDYGLNQDGDVIEVPYRRSCKDVVVAPFDGYEFINHMDRVSVRKKATKKYFLVVEHELDGYEIPTSVVINRPERVQAVRFKVEEREVA